VQSKFLLRTYNSSTGKRLNLGPLLPTRQVDYNKKRYLSPLTMTSYSDDLSGLRDDMVAFVEGHGLRRFPGRIEYEWVPSVLWKPEENPDSWKDFVEMAKASGALFVTMDGWRLKREELDEMLERLASVDFAGGEEIEDARWLRTYIGKTGYVQMGFAYQGVMMVFEASTEWWERYQHLIEMIDEFGGIPMGPSSEGDF
jgi:hypothetical protein